MKNIISVVADSAGKAILYQRAGETVLKTNQYFDNWFVSASKPNFANCEIKELDGNQPLRYLVKPQGKNSIDNIKYSIQFNNVQQYLIASGNTYFKNMEFNELHRLQFDIETTTKKTGYISNPEFDEIYLIAVSDTSGYEEVITGTEPEIIQKLIDIIRVRNPDVIENHNIFGFDSPFLCKRAEKYGIKLTFGRDGSEIFSYPDSVKIGGQVEKFRRFAINGREIIDTMFLTRRHIAELRSKGYGLKNTAKYLGIASRDRTYIAGEKIWDTWKTNPDKVLKYALDDVREARVISDNLLPIDFELTKIFPDKLEHVATAGTATMIDLLLVKEYLNAGYSIPEPTSKKEKYSGGLSEIYRKGVLKDIVKADVSSMYPSIMLAHHVKPDNDPLGIFQQKLRELTNQRLQAKSKLKELAKDPTKYKATDAYQKGLKLIINSFYGYLGTNFTHFNSPNIGAPKVTAIGRDILTKMLEIGEKLNGIPVEADTDGIYFAGIAEDKAKEFVNKINSELAHEGITIDLDGYWKSMYSYGKKNYALLETNGRIAKKGIFNKSGEESFISEAKDRILQLLFKGRIEQINSLYKQILEKARNKKLTLSDIVIQQRLGKDLSEFGKSTAAHVKVLKDSGITDARQGYLVEYYKDTDRWKLATEFSGTYDTQHYMSRFSSVIQKTFAPAFANTDNEIIFGNKQLELNLDRIQPQVSEVHKEPAVVDETKATAWIELSHGNKLQDQPIDRWNWSRIDDIDRITEFVEKYDYLDVHRSNVAYWSDEAPITANLSHYKQAGDFFLEIEGKEFDQDLQGNDIQDDRNNVVVECSRAVVDRLIELGVSKSDIVVYYNGGKSIYIFIPMAYICSEPRFRLNEVYQKITEDLIIPELPDEFKKLIDTQIYQFKHSLRLLNTKHHQGRFGYNIDFFALNSRNWKELTDTEVTSTEVKATFTNALPTDDTKIIKEFAKIANQIEDTSFLISGVKRGSKRKSYRDNIKQVEYILNNVNPGYIQPCILNISRAIAKKESIGFGGRNKLISEMLILFRAKGYTDRDIENEICKIFLSNGAPNRYGVLQKDDRDDPNPCGYRLKMQYFDIPKLETFDPKCQACKEFCNPAKCYRHKQFKPDKAPTPYDEFITKGRQNTANAILSADFERDGITAIDAPLVSGKTYQICKKATELANNNELSIIFTHSHDASQEICNNITNMSLQNGACVNMRGKSSKGDVTCFQENPNCQSCKFRGAFFSKDKEERESARQQLVMQCKGQVVDLQKAQQLADEYGVCPFVIMRALAITMRSGIVVANHNYLGDVNLHNILSLILADYYFVDEADQLITNIISRYQEKMVVAKTRSNLLHTYRQSCDNQCSKCKLHFADIWSRGLDTRQLIKSSELEQIQSPQNFIDTLRNAVKTVKELPAGSIYEIFDFDTLNANIGRLDKVLSLIDTNKNPYDAITDLERKLLDSNLDFLTVDKIYEGSTTHDGKIIFPDENIVSINVDNPVNEAAIEMFFNPNPDEYDDISNDSRSLTYSKLFTNNEERVKLSGTETESAIKICLAFTNLCIKGKGKIGLYFETRRTNDDNTIPNAKQNLMSCGLSLRVFDLEGFKKVIGKMENHKTLLLSGTFIDQKKLATSLMVQPPEIEYIDATEPMHDRFLIIHSGAKGQKTEGIKIASIGNTHIMQIWRRVDELLENAKILDFKKNTTQGNIFFNAVSEDFGKNKNFKVENHCNPKNPGIAHWSLAEAQATGIETRSLLVVDKLRSARARAVNRQLFNVCCVHGNGYVNWYDFLPYVQKIRDTVDPDIELDDMFEYDRRKVVAQALTRAPRDENRTVGLYFGDMPYVDYPEYLKPCVVLLDELKTQLKEEYPADFLDNRENQIELTARVVVAFIKGEVTHTDFSAAFKDFKFVGEYKGGRREARKEQFDLSLLTETDRYVVQSFIEKYKGGADDAKVFSNVVEKLNQIKQSISSKGYLDKREDKKGNRKDWNNILNYLVSIGYLAETKIDTGGRPKMVLKTNENHDDN